MKYQLNTTYLVILYNFQASGDDERNFINRLASKINVCRPFGAIDIVQLGYIHDVGEIICGWHVWNVGDRFLT